jgi:hypothetical protein
MKKLLLLILLFASHNAFCLNENHSSPNNESIKKVENFLNNVNSI